VLIDLSIKNMSASAKGTEAEPGKNVRLKAGLNRSIQSGETPARPENRWLRLTPRPEIPVLQGGEDVKVIAY